MNQFCFYPSSVNDHKYVSDFYIYRRKRVSPFLPWTTIPPPQPVPSSPAPEPAGMYPYHTAFVTKHSCCTLPSRNYYTVLATYTHSTPCAVLNLNSSTRCWRGCDHYHWNENVLILTYFHHWLHWKLSFWQLTVQPMVNVSSKWRHFRFSPQCLIVSIQFSSEFN